jgi:hypothetical protein
VLRQAICPATFFPPAIATEDFPGQKFSQKLPFARQLMVKKNS